MLFFTRESKIFCSLATRTVSYWIFFDRTNGDDEGQTGNHYTLISRFACPLADWLFTTGGTEQQPSVGVRKLIGGSDLEALFGLLEGSRLCCFDSRILAGGLLRATNFSLLSLSLAPYGPGSVCSSRQEDLQDSIHPCSGTTKQLLPICVNSGKRLPLSSHSLK